MKKFLVVILVLCAITPVFAGLSGDIGMATGYDFFFFKGNNADKFQQIQGVPLGIKGSLYFGDGKLAMGLDYGLDFFNYPLKIVVGKNPTKLDEKAIWFAQPRAGLGLKYAFNDAFALKAGLGASFYSGPACKILGFADDIKMTRIGIYADAGLSIEIGHVALLGGVKADFTVSSSWKHEDADDFIEGTMKYIDVAPYVGIGYSF